MKKINRAPAIPLGPGAYQLKISMLFVFVMGAPVSAPFFMPASKQTKVAAGNGLGSIFVRIKGLLAHVCRHPRRLGAILSF